MTLLDVSGAVFIGSAYYSEVVSGLVQISNVSISNTTNFGAPMVISTALSASSVIVDSCVFSDNQFKLSGGLLINQMNPFQGLAITVRNNFFGPSTPIRNSTFSVQSMPFVACLLSDQGDPISSLALEASNTFASATPLANFGGASCIFTCQKNFDSQTCSPWENSSHHLLKWWEWALIGICAFFLICVLVALLFLYTCRNSRSATGYQQIN
jgi:hypothetical protein